MVVSSSKAFSYIELVFAIVIFGVILTLALPKLTFSAKICQINLSTRLATMQNELSLIFTHAQLSQTPIDKNKIYSIFHTLEDGNTSKCSIRFNQQTSTIEAISERESVKFSIIPKDFSVNPKISCPLINPLCKKLSFKTKQK